MNEGDVQFSLILNVEGALDNANKLNTILHKGGNILRKIAGKDENIQAAINNAQRLVSTLNRARVIAVSIRNALSIGLGGPAGWIMAVFAGISAGEFAIDVVSSGMDDSVYDNTWGV